MLTLVFLSAFLVLSAEGNPSDEITIFFTGFVRGNYGPCGCSAGPTGGVSRRVGYANEFEKENPGFTLHVDAGNYLQPPGPRSDLINRLMVESFEEVPLAVLNLGIEDLFWWQDLSKAQKGQTKIISTNLISEAPGVPQPYKYAIVEVPAKAISSGRDIRIGFLGIADPAKIKPNSKFRGIDPLEAISEIKQEVMEKADFLIVLADMSREGLEIPEDSIFRKLAESHSEIVAILVTERRYRLYRPVRINSAVVLSTVERGRYLGQLTLGLDKSAAVTKFGAEFIELKEGVPEVEALRVKQDWITAQLP
jgi:2',3'-cyclic-nucleotide 2'-phosphodiesterase (5'-nucleotidase family)